MTGSMYASVAGLRAHMQKLTVIGNNVANVNTQAYKKQRTVFRDSIYSMYTSGSDGTQVVGGKNPSQLGYGSLVANIDLNMSSAAYNPGNPMDCAIVGDGFFLVGNKDLQDTMYRAQPEELPELFKSLKLTRVGDFQFKPDGYLSDGQGNVVYGFQCVGYYSKDNPPPAGKEIGDPIMSDQLVALRLPKMEKTIIDKNSGDPITPNAGGTYDQGILDANGNPTENYEWGYTIRYPVNKSATTEAGGTGGTTGTDGEQRYIELRDYSPRLDRASEDGNQGGTGTGDTIANSEDELEYAELESIQIDAKTGCISGTARNGGAKVIIGYLAMGIVQNPNGVEHTGSSYYRAGPGAGDLRITLMGGAEKELGMTYVYGETNQSVANDGNTNTETTQSVLPDGAQITSAGDVQLMTGFLEGPNVDLAEEITELITTQRGYQANTRIITVTDSMLEELVNMKR